MTDASKLEGAELDAAVAKALGWIRFTPPGENVEWWGTKNKRRIYWSVGAFSPTRNWEQAGPIIERERLQLDPYDIPGDVDGRWFAKSYKKDIEGWGPTPLIAAMRVFVASRA